MQVNLNKSQKIILITKKRELEIEIKNNKIILY